MKKVKDLKLSSRAWWMAQNPDALTVTKNDLLKKSWNETAHEVNDEGRAIALMHNRWMVGTVVPAAFLYEFHRKMPQLRELDPIIHVPEKDFKSNFEHYAGQLEKGTNVVVLDAENRPKFAVATHGFSIDIETDENGYATFRDEMAQYMFNDVELDQEALRREVEEAEKDDELKYMMEAAKELPDETPPMSDEDAQKVDRVLAEIAKVTPNRRSIENAVQNLSFD